MGLLVVLISVSALFVRYVRKPAPLPELIGPQLAVNYPPHYLSSIYGAEKPVGVAVSPDGQRIYVAESGGERAVRVFDRAGKEIGQLVPPGVDAGERSPVYVATDNAGRVYVTDRMQFAIYVYGSDGAFLDAILAPDLTLSGYAGRAVGAPVVAQNVAYNAYRPTIAYRPADGTQQALPLPQLPVWAPLGIRIDRTGALLLTDVPNGRHRVRIWNISRLAGGAPWSDFNPTESQLGASGQDNGQFLFPNSAVTDSTGRIFVSDGNNGRIVVWDRNGSFLFNFGRGMADGALNLPRGLFMDGRDRLHVVDAVGQSVHVYDVSRAEPAFLYSFGDVGAGDGQFDFPNDIAMDASGRLYIADRENNRIQIWSY